MNDFLDVQSHGCFLRDFYVNVSVTHFRHRVSLCLLTFLRLIINHVTPSEAAIYKPDRNLLMLKDHMYNIML